MIDSQQLLTDLQQRMRLLEHDLLTASDDPENSWGVGLRAEYDAARQAGRTALTWSAWREGEIAQAAVAWIVATAFIRFCEDNELLPGGPWLAGPGDQLERALEAEAAYYSAQPTMNSRDWMRVAFGALADLPAGRDLLDRAHNPVWRADISAEAAKELVAFWRRTDDTGELVHDFTDPELNTRFLGDLYQDLSAYARKTFALLQTPEFVEEFILDLTLDPALQEFGVRDFKLIDPTCGSGHFLIGAFHRLLDAWKAHSPNAELRVLTQRALASVHGVDINPFAVAIARFRLTIAALHASKAQSLANLPKFEFQIAVGDSLLGQQGQQTELDLTGEPTAEETAAAFVYSNEDINRYQGILEPGQYHAVVGNPPYITVKDAALNGLYRKAYESTYRQYALSVPFAELFFRLARVADDAGGSGHVGQITSNSFMKREFGKKLIEDYFSGKNLQLPIRLTHVIDTSGAYIPGHGTPTVILIGRRERPNASEVRAVLGVRGEPGTPKDPARGLVWSEITGHINDEEYDGTFVTVTGLSQSTFDTHPWSLAGGGARELFAVLSCEPAVLERRVTVMGRYIHTGLDDAYFSEVGWCNQKIAPAFRRFLIEGNALRDWNINLKTETVFPYDTEFEASIKDRNVYRILWRNRRLLSERREPGGTHAEIGLTWFEFSRWHPERYRISLGIAFAFVATHNHFVLDRGGKVFKQSAPVIKLPEDATEDDHLELLGVLNSSTACFWLKQVSHNKGDSTDSRGARVTGDPAFDTYEFTGTKLQEFPLPGSYPLERARILDSLAQDLGKLDPAVQVPEIFAENPDANATELAENLRALEAHAAEVRARMIHHQEELDWEVYQLYGLIEADLTYSGSEVLLELGQRAFEIKLAREVAAGIEQTSWFTRHGSQPLTEIPSDLPADYQELLQRRLDAIEASREIRLLERPEYKRRWNTPSWEERERAALEKYVLDRLEARELWWENDRPVMRSIAQLADLLRHDKSLRIALELLSGTSDIDVVPLLTRLIRTQAVPYLAAWRYKDSGITKYREWQEVWRLQRLEDDPNHLEKVTIPVPPHYKQADFRSAAYWGNRGKLDVPKERFIEYPGLQAGADDSMVLGWAGWDHREQALALALKTQAVSSALDASAEQVTPLLAGLQELEPWLHQWHSEVDPAIGQSVAEFITGFINQQLASHELTRPELENWRPAPTRTRRTRKKA